MPQLRCPSIRYIMPSFASCIHQRCFSAMRPKSPVIARALGQCLIPFPSSIGPRRRFIRFPQQRGSHSLDGRVLASRSASKTGVQKSWFASRCAKFENHVEPKGAIASRAWSVPSYRDRSYTSDSQGIQNRSWKVDRGLIGGWVFAPITLKKDCFVCAHVLHQRGM